MNLLRVKIIVALGVGVLAFAVFFLLWEREGTEGLEQGGAIEEEVGRGVQSVVVVFADPSATRLVEETREIEVPEDRAKRGMRIMEELARGPRGGGGVRTLPQGTLIRSVVFDDRGGAFVDFSRELIDGHPGGSTGELMTISSVVQTLVRNFPDVAQVTFLVEGRQIESVAGHIDATVPFSVDQYR
ncbi:MAG: GerMN domain-containing protein [Candidatus Eisenbacteria bacterium]